jgi:hypothetical protein
MPAIERSGLLTTDLVAKPARATMATLSPVICRLYGLFLDRDREYSCAYFPKGTETLERGTPHHRRPDFIGVPIYTPGTAEPDGARTRQPKPSPRWNLMTARVPYRGSTHTCPAQNIPRRVKKIFLDHITGHIAQRALAHRADIAPDKGQS